MNNFCFFWVNTTPKWSNSNWTWQDCETATEVCKVWSTDSDKWKNANMWWSQCFGTGSIPPIPPPTGSVISASLQPLGIDATTIIQPWLIEPWNPYRAGEIEKKKRLVKLICKVRGQTFEEEKEIGDMKVSVDDVKMVVKSVLGVDLDFKKLEE